MRLPTRSRTTRAIALAGAAAVLLAACSTGEGVEAEGLDEAPDAGASDPADLEGGGEGGRLVAALRNTPDQFDPHATTSAAAFQVLENVYDTLVVPNAEDLTFEPSLAEEWTTSEDGLEWVFTLREGVVFHDGSELDAADVVYSFTRIIDEELANAFRFANVESVEATGDLEVTMTLTAPTPNLLANVGGFKGMAILPEGAADEVDLATTAVGTGPFELTSTSAGGAELDRFADYWGEPVALEGVEVRYVGESAAALTGLENGDIDWTDNVPPQDIERLEGDDAVELGRTGGSDYFYMAFNQTRPPFDDPDVRRAIALAVDRDEVAEAATFGAGTPNQTAIPDESFWASDLEPFETDPEQAQQLLADAGQEDLSFSVMVPESEQQAVTIAEVVSAQLADIGVTMTPEPVETGIFLDRQGEGDFDAFSWSWIGNIDPYDFYHAQHLSDGGFNFQGYENAEVDELLLQAASEVDEDARKELYDQAVELIAGEVSYLYYYNPDIVQAWRPEVTGFEVRPDAAVNFDTVTLDG
jgi:peptide/nickel transport system substrate-binding protein